MTSPTKEIEDDVRFGFLDRTHSSRGTRNPQLIRNSDDSTMLRAIRHELATTDTFTFSVAFVTPGGLSLMKQDLLNARGKGELITSTYLNFNSPATFRELLAIDGLKVSIVGNQAAGFHSKGYLFHRGSDSTAIIGSSNLSRGALVTNSEWNLRVSSLYTGDLTQQLQRAVRAQAEQAVPLSTAWIEQYEATWTPPVAPPSVREVGPDSVLPSGAITPNAMQTVALREIAAVRAAKATRALVVSATGTGKTILAALAVRDMNPKRVLFIAHREQILAKAAEEFRRVLGWHQEGVGRFAGARQELDRPHVFATIQTLSKPQHLANIRPDAFDLIIVDEVHRAAAESYLRILDHFTPRFTLGLTATPERTDGYNLYELFDYNVPFEIRLQQALEEDMLAPFAYYGVEDYTDDSGGTIDAKASLQSLLASGRVEHIVAMLERYGHSGAVRGLIFCSRNEEATNLASALSSSTVHGKQLRAAAISGTDSLEVREEHIRRLENNELDYLVTVDIFNEGIDIPTVNQVVMLRQTSSSIVFTQQLGRGLRKAPGKDHLRVIDFIGNYENNYLIPIALYGNNSANKDDIRKRLIEADSRGTIAGVSSVNFTKIAKDRIFRSLETAKLTHLQELKKATLDLQHRLGRTPMLMDFARADSVDPVIMATQGKNYFQLLKRMKLIEGELPPELDALLTFITRELVNGMRSQELLLLRRLLETCGDSLSRDDLTQLLIEHQVDASPETVESAIRMMTLEFATELESKNVIGTPTVKDDGSLSLGDALRSGYASHDVFRRFLDDLVATGLKLSKDRYGHASGLVVGKRYTRKDACRLLNWRTNSSSTVYGYKTDEATKTCPIFVTYHKSSEVSEGTAYEDAFIDHHTMRWFTRSPRRLNSPEVRRLLTTHDPIAMHLFVKKDDSEGTDFYYVGRVRPSGAAQDKMPTNGNPVVTMKLHLETPLPQGMFEYFVGEAVEEASPIGRVDYVETPPISTEPASTATTPAATRKAPAN